MLLGFSESQVCIFGPLRIWAERGLIHVEDARDNSYDTFSVRTELRRINALSDMLANSRESLRRDRAMDVAMYDRIQKAVEQLALVCRRGQEQGMPSDARASREAVTRRPKTFLVPGMKSAM